MILAGNGMRVAVTIVICLVLYGTGAGSDDPLVRYDGYQVWRVTPRSDVELEALTLISDRNNLSYWIEPSSVGRPVDVMVPPSSADNLASFFNRSFSSFEVLQTDIQRVITKQYMNRVQTGLGFTYDEYNNLSQINRWIDSIERKHKGVVTIITIGTSYEGRTIRALKISVPVQQSRFHGNETLPRKSIFIQGGIHAREWISPATVIYMTNQLLKQYDKRQDVRMMLDNFDWYILPVFNVDGYEYTWTNDRLWRKTRSPTSIQHCKGTDPNRNWDNHWCEAGASKNPCSETYCGSGPFSEVEVKAVSTFLTSGINFIGFIDIHSYSQLWMTPYGYSTSFPSDYIKQNTQSKLSVRALSGVFGTVYEYGSIANTLYEASGSSVDWTYDNADILYSATLELRDMGEYGFLLPADQIIPTGKETFEGLVEYAQFIMTHISN
ncbi:carboxypeptidase B-like isoform X1 [Lytechinus pictus]|uniref:carboxypeptidase B-like isoform X1 n=1 Tax=Lytechinus pictus TaxID=7653 RepID=UPI0030B9CC85